MGGRLVLAAYLRVTVRISILHLHVRTKNPVFHKNENTVNYYTKLNEIISKNVNLERNLII